MQVLLWSNPSAWLGHLAPLLTVQLLLLRQSSESAIGGVVVIMADLLTLSFLGFTYICSVLFSSLLFPSFCLLWCFSFSFPSSLLFWCAQDGVQDLPQWRKKLIFLVALKGVNIKEASQHVHATACWWLAGCQSGVVKVCLSHSKVGGWEL